MPKNSTENPQLLVKQTDVQYIKEIVFVVSLIAALFFIVALLTYSPSDSAWSIKSGNPQINNAAGVVGAWISDYSFSLFGISAYLLPFLLIFFSWQFYHQQLFSIEKIDILIFKLIGLVMMIFGICGITFLFFQNIVVLPQGVGGIFGGWLGSFAINYGSNVGATLLLWSLFFVGSTLLFNISWIKIADILGGLVLMPIRIVTKQDYKIKSIITQRNLQKQKIRHQKKIIQQQEQLHARDKIKISPIVKDIQVGSRKNIESQASLFESSKADPNMTNVSVLPKLDLLSPAVLLENGYSAESLQAMSRQVELKLKDFNVNVEVTGVQPGPVVTRFEFMPAPGIKASKITGLATDLARSLSQVSVRVVEVIPGKSVVGLEIPNEIRQTVYLSEIISSTVYENSKSKLTIALGKDIAGNPIVADLAKMPHVLVAGTTGSGKSVCINTMVLSLLYKSTPDDVRMIMIDPKMLELSVYEGIPHLLSPVVTDMSEAANALRWSVAEMERRYKLMALLGVRNLAGYNKKVTDAIKAGTPLNDPMISEDAEPKTLEKLPFVVIMIDEFADMIMVIGKKVEELIIRLAQKARAAGIHLVLATQRPSVDVITGLIKSNIPTRMAFQVSSKMDSRVILDQMGAENLLGKGDMLYLPPGQAFAERIHGAFVDDDEVHRVVEFLKANYETNYLQAVLSDYSDTNKDNGNSENGDESDVLYDDAVAVVLKTGKASISGVQRQLKIGYNRAARIIEAMEAAGIVSAPKHNGQREIIVPSNNDLT